MDWSASVVVPLLTSTVVAGLVSFILKMVFESRMQHNFDLKLEKLRHSYEVEMERLRTELAIRAGTAHEVTERQLAAYPGIVEAVYRIRNMAREVNNNNKEVNTILIDELSYRARELEQKLYEYRMDLERDSIFLPLHTYKNAAKTFVRLTEDRAYHQKRDDTDSASEVTSQLDRLYEDIEAQHKPIIEDMSGLFPSTRDDV